MHQRLKYILRISKPVIISIGYIFLLSLLSSALFAQAGRSVRGMVVDSISGEPLPFVAIQVENITDGCVTDDKGHFSIVLGNGYRHFKVSYLGYKPKRVAIPATSIGFKIQMVPDSYAIGEVVVRPGGERYRKKGNPSVELMKRVIARKNSNRAFAADYFERKTYEKTSLALTKIKLKARKDSTKNLSGFADTSEVTGVPILTLSLKERMMDQYFRKSPYSLKSIVNGSTSIGIDDQIFEEDMVSDYLQNLFKEIDIYDNNIRIGFKPFVSPLSVIATDFYKFYLKDTVMIDSVKYTRMEFAPFNSADFGFTGELYISTDTTLSVRKAKLNVPKNTNINYLANLRLIQEFAKNKQGTMQMTQDELIAEFYVVPGLQGVYVKRQRAFADYQYGINNDSILSSIAGDVLVKEQAKQQTQEFWQESRLIPLVKNENKMAAFIDKLSKNIVVRAIVRTAEIIVKGFISTGANSKIDLGPFYTFMSGSTIEGFRVKVGGETTANLNAHLFGAGYVAYGTLDNRVKYQGTLEYSFNAKKYHAREFPVNSLALMAKNDVYTLGEEPIGTPQDNLFYAIKRMRVTQMEYQKILQLKYTYEHRSGFSLFAWGKYQQDEAAWGKYPQDDPAAISSIYFRPLTNTSRSEIPHTIPFLNTAEAGITLRYAPKEDFIQGRIYRFNLKNKYPVFELTHKAAFKGFLGTDYGYQKTELKYMQRFFFSAFGRLDVWLRAGKIWTGDVAFPHLFTPNANTSFTVIDESFSQVNPLEFVADQYASLDIGLRTNGLLFNLIPGVKRLKLREVAGFKLYWGHLSDKNNPAFNKSLLEFPTVTGLMGKEPYMEFSVGIDNIFSILRVDYVRRINYLDRPGVSPNGVRVTLSFTF